MSLETAMNFEDSVIVIYPLCGISKIVVMTITFRSMNCCVNLVGEEKLRCHLSVRLLLLGQCILLMAVQVTECDVCVASDVMCNHSPSY